MVADAPGAPSDVLLHAGFRSAHEHMRRIMGHPRISSYVGSTRRRVFHDHDTLDKYCAEVRDALAR